MRTNRLSNINESTNSFESNLLSSTVRFNRIDAAMLIIINESQSVGAESDQQVNIYSFAVRCDRRWPNTQ